VSKHFSGPQAASGTIFRVIGGFLSMPQKPQKPATKLFADGLLKEYVEYPAVTSNNSNYCF
jgi:hypothetical protein